MLQDFLPSPVRPLFLTDIFQALSSGYMPIGAVFVGPEVADVIYSQSNKLGILMKDFNHCYPSL